MILRVLYQFQSVGFSLTSSNAPTTAGCPAIQLNKCCLPRGSIRFYRLRAQSHKTYPPPPPTHFR